MPRFVLAIATLLPLAAASPAWAQFPDPWTALTTSPQGSMTCREFSRLPASDRAEIVRKMNDGAPQASLATGVGNDITANNAGAISPRGSRNTVPGTPLTAGELVGYCQRVGAQSSLRDAFSFANSGQSTPLILGR